nr:amidase [Parvularcula lutaonensis]
MERFERYQKRIATLDGDLHAFLHLRLDDAKREAEASEARLRKQEALSPIDGWCVAIKANIAVAGMPWHAGIAAYKDRLAEQDAECVRRLKSAGAVILGIVNMDEGALGATCGNEAFGRTHNPWRHGNTPGGSSGGSAAAVAADLCDIALGSDTMGSVRIPSAYCGVQGFKPSRGLVSLDGVLALSPTLDHIGPHARTVSKLRQSLAAMTGRAFNRQKDDASGIKIGVWLPLDDVAMQPDILERFNEVIEILAARGLSCRNVQVPAYRFGYSRRAGLLVSEFEAAAIHKDRLEADPGGFSQTFRKMMEWSLAQPAEKREVAYRHLEEISESAPTAFSDVDFILAPTAPQSSFAFEEEVPANQADLTAWANFAGLPACAIWSGFSPSGLPLSLQVIGPPNSDGAVLDMAEAIEDFLGQPPVPPRFR